MKTFLKSIKLGGFIGILGIAMSAYNMIANKPTVLLFCIFGYVTIMCAVLMVILFNEAKTQ